MSLRVSHISIFETQGDEKEMQLGLAIPAR